MLQNLVQLMAVKAPVLNFVDIPVIPSHFMLVLQCGFFPKFITLLLLGSYTGEWSIVFSWILLHLVNTHSSVLAELGPIVIKREFTNVSFVVHTTQSHLFRCWWWPEVNTDYASRKLQRKIWRIWIYLCNSNCIFCQSFHPEKLWLLLSDVLKHLVECFFLRLFFFLKQCIGEFYDFVSQY